MSRSFYSHHPRSVQDVEFVWGQPVDITSLDGGIEKRTYMIQISTDAAFAYRFFIIDKDLVVSSGISDTLDLVAK